MKASNLLIDILTGGNSDHERKDVTERQVMFDPFRPHFEPARQIYDGILAAAEHRKGVDPDVWIQSERVGVFNIARDYAMAFGLTVPTMEQIERAENQACGHTDYAAKWAHGVSDIITNNHPAQL